MPALHLNAVVTASLLDDTFRQAILGSHSYECLSRFALTENERSAIVRASPRNIEQLAGVVHNLIHDSQRLYTSAAVIAGN